MSVDALGRCTRCGRKVESTGGCDCRNLEGMDLAWMGEVNALVDGTVVVEKGKEVSLGGDVNGRFIVEDVGAPMTGGVYLTLKKVG